MRRFLGFAVLGGVAAMVALAPARAEEDGEKPWEKRKREAQDAAGGVPEAVLALQSLEKVRPVPLDEAIRLALALADEVAGPLLGGKPREGARTLRVPGDHASIQAALDAASAGDTVVVAAGTWYEQVVLRDGVRLVSDASEGGDEPQVVEGARLALPRRTLRTILDGSKARASKRGMIDFEPGAGRGTVVDGFTICNLPRQNHHLPGHAHALNLRGASPVVRNCLVRGNGSTGIGSHVVYRDQETPFEKRDFRRANVRHEASAVLYRNVVCGNLGLGIGCNHFATPQILGNEILGNDDSDLGEEPSPGIGAQHGAAPVVVGNLVHDNPGGGVLCKAGEPQGSHAIDGPTAPLLRGNVVWRNGKDRPGLSCSAAGTRERPAILRGNWIYDAGLAGIGVSRGSVAVLEENLVCRSGQAGIALHGSLVPRLVGNRVTGAAGPGFTIVDGAEVLEMTGNAADSNEGPRFLLRGGTIRVPKADKAPQPSSEGETRK